MSNSSAKLKSNIENLEELNDDCLGIICSKLEPHDQFQFALVCQRFHDVYASHCAPKCRFLQMNMLSGFTFAQKTEFFETTGRYIKEFNATRSLIQNEYSKRNFDLTLKFGANIQVIRFAYSRIKPSYWHSFFANMKAVTNLDLSFCCMCDDDILAMEQIQNLVVLKLKFHKNITGKYLYTHTKLRYLDLEGCCNIETAYFIEIFKSLRDLQTLKLMKCNLSGNALIALMAHCHGIEVLSITCRQDVDAECIAQLPGLKCLSIAEVMQLPLMAALVRHKCNQLEHLEIYTNENITYEEATQIARLHALKELNFFSVMSFDDYHMHKFCELKNLEIFSISSHLVTDAGLSILLENCTKLRHVDVGFCNKICGIFIFEAIEILQQRKEQLQQPVFFNIFGTGVKQRLLKNPIYSAASSLLRCVYFKQSWAKLVGHGQKCCDPMYC